MHFAVRNGLPTSRMELQPRMQAVFHTSAAPALPHPDSGRAQAGRGRADSDGNNILEAGILLGSAWRRAGRRSPSHRASILDPTSRANIQKANSRKFAPFTIRKCAPFTFSKCAPFTFSLLHDKSGHCALAPQNPALCSPKSPFKDPPSGRGGRLLPRPAAPGASPGRILRAR